MKQAYLHILSLSIVILGLAFVIFLYWSQPKTIAEVGTKGSVVLGTYNIDRAEFERGLEAFRRDDFLNARAAFDRADPEHQNAEAQFYVAYSFYRQGWGRLSSDNALFGQGLKAVDRVMAIDPNFRSSDTSLGLRTPLELKSELEDGLKITLSDLDPRRLVCERK